MRAVYVAALIGWALMLGGQPAQAKGKHPRDGQAFAKTWPVVYTANVARSDGAPGTCPVRISTDGKAWPRPVSNYEWVDVDDKCDASGLAVHDNVTRNNAGPDQK